MFTALGQLSPAEFISYCWQWTGIATEWDLKISRWVRYLQTGGAQLLQNQFGESIWAITVNTIQRVTGKAWVQIFVSLRSWVTPNNREGDVLSVPTRTAAWRAVWRVCVIRVIAITVAAIVQSWGFCYRMSEEWSYFTTLFWIVFTQFCPFSIYNL